MYNDWWLQSCIGRWHPPTFRVALNVVTRYGSRGCDKSSRNMQNSHWSMSHIIIWVVIGVWFNWNVDVLNCLSCSRDSTISYFLIANVEYRNCVFLYDRKSGWTEVIYIEIRINKWYKQLILRSHLSFRAEAKIIFKFGAKAYIPNRYHAVTSRQENRAKIQKNREVVDSSATFRHVWFI